MERKDEIVLLEIKEPLTAKAWKQLLLSIVVLRSTLYAVAVLR